LYVHSKGRHRRGLTIAKQIVEMHDGRIRVEPALGKGSSFQMGLPFAARSARAPDDDAHSRRESPGHPIS